VTIIATYECWREGVAASGERLSKLNIHTVTVMLSMGHKDQQRPSKKQAKLDCLPCNMGMGTNFLLVNLDLSRSMNEFE
jgi:hypothetical protein